MEEEERGLLEEPLLGGEGRTNANANANANSSATVTGRGAGGGPRYVPSIVHPTVARRLPVATDHVPPLTHRLQGHAHTMGAIQRAQALSQVTGQLLQSNQRRPKSAPRERRTVKLPENDLLQAQRTSRVSANIDIQRRGSRVGATVDDPSEVAGRSPSKNPSFESITAAADMSSGRITVYCVAEKFAKGQLLDVLRSKPMDEHRKGGLGRARLCDGVLAEVSNLQWDGEVLTFSCTSQWTGADCGEIFCFEYGVCVFWGFSSGEEEHCILRDVFSLCSIEPLKPSDVEDEEFKYQYVLGQPPRIENDTIIMGVHLSKNSVIKLGIAYPLAQSTKLKIYESRIQQKVDSYIELPRTLAETGKVNLTKRRIHQLIGTIFLEKCAVNLLTTVLDTPDFFWDASDALCGLYDSLFEYLEIADRVEILNARFEILEAMLDMLRDQNQNEHSSFLEWIVIILIVVEVVIGLVEILGLCGIIRQRH
ncbi:DUF155 domain-containing protein [Chloropicon primus]|uniref:DUF155 domain-containing protein n=2 Tax=Chloropicon primus TaxID=1764295 RepID=A0A5B8MD82_9CHLO|nr:DUF155 domain-containing protein [Chloropicon primus]UPQ97747.1 DUF155 domain-containing protein [Chloropicon primus]|eukprot:QDZ18538.1 DUF155 domain-containing protein [Chloropicon primus]